MAFTEISPYEMQGNPFSMIFKDWMLVTAGDETRCNTMTASWGQMGIMWNKPVVNVYIRPQRYTREFVEANERFSLSFFEPGTRRAELNLLGTKSGRDGDKIAEAGLHVTHLGGVPTFEEARLVLVCRKLYRQDIDGAHFLQTELDGRHYAEKDYHRMYVAEVEKVFVAQ